MRVHVKLFAIVRDRAGTDGLAIELPDRATVANAAAELKSRLPAIAEFLARSAFAINQSYVNSDATLHEGDELAVIPPVSGG